MAVEEKIKEIEIKVKEVEAKSDSAYSISKQALTEASNVRSKLESQEKYSDERVRGIYAEMKNFKDWMFDIKAQTTKYHEENDRRWDEDRKFNVKLAFSVISLLLTILSSLFFVIWNTVIVP